MRFLLDLSFKNPHLWKGFQADAQYIRMSFAQICIDLAFCVMIIGHSKASFHCGLTPLCTAAKTGQRLMNNPRPSVNRAFPCRCFSNYLASCNSTVLQFRWEVIKKHKGGMTHRLYFLILSATRFNMILLSISGANLS